VASVREVPSARALKAVAIAAEARVARVLQASVAPVPRAVGHRRKLTWTSLLGKRSPAVDESHAHVLAGPSRMVSSERSALVAQTASSMRLQKTGTAVPAALRLCSLAELTRPLQA